MLAKAILIALIAWVAASGIEFTCWSIELCAPFVFGPLVGLVMGDVQAGLIIGCMTMLVYMGNIMVGGVASVNFVVAGVIATAMAVGSGAGSEMAVTIAVSLGMIGMVAETVFMTSTSFFVHKADKYAAEGNTKGIVLCNVVAPLALKFLLYAVPAFLCVYFGVNYMEKLLAVLPEGLFAALEAVGMLLPALGLAMLIKVLFKVRFLPYFIIGFVMTTYVGLDIIGVSLIGAACAIMFWFNNKKDEANQVEVLK